MNENKINLPILASGVGVGLIGRFLGRLIAVLGGVLIARVLGPSVFGLYAIGIVVLRLSEAIIPMGFDLGVIRFGAMYLNDNQRVKGILFHSLLIPFCFGLIAALLVWFFAPMMSTQLFGQPEMQLVLRYVAVIVPMLALLVIASAATRVSQNVVYSFITQDVGQPLLSLLGVLVVMWFGLGLKGVLAAEVISVLVTAVLALVFLARIFPFLAGTGVSIVPPPGDFYRFSITSSLSVIFITAMFWVDRIILSMYILPNEVGVYQAAAQASVIFAVLLGGMNRIITPVFANLYNKADLQEINEVFVIGTKWALYLGVPLLIILFAHPLNILVGVFGEQYSPGVYVLTILLVGQGINLLTGSVGPLLNVAGYQTRLMFFACIALVVNIGSDLILVPAYGIVGAAASMSFSLGAYYLVLLFLARYKLGVWPFDRRYGKITVAALVCLVISIGTEALVEQISLVFILGELILLYALFYSIVFMIGLDKEDRVFVSMVRSFFQRRFHDAKI